VSASTIEAVGGFAGPAIGGLVVAASTGAAFLVTAATFLWSAALVARLRPERRLAESGPAGAPPSLGSEVLAGFRTVVGQSRLRVVVGLYIAQTVVAGGL